LSDTGISYYDTAGIMIASGIWQALGMEAQQLLRYNSVPL